MKKWKEVVIGFVIGVLVSIAVTAVASSDLDIETVYNKCFDSTLNALRIKGV